MDADIPAHRALRLIKDAPPNPFEAARQDGAQRATLALAAKLLESAGPAVMRVHKIVEAAIGMDQINRSPSKATAASALEVVIADLQAVAAELRA